MAFETPHQVQPRGVIGASRARLENARFCGKVSEAVDSYRLAMVNPEPIHAIRRHPIRMIAVVDDDCPCNPAEIVIR